VIQTGPVRVLLIDDAPLFRRMLATAIDGAGGAHCLACDGQIASVRTQLMQFHPEVILLDLTLTTTNPFELLQKLRTHYPVPIIVLAANRRDSQERAFQAVARGALEAVRRPDNARPALLAAFARELVAKLAGAAVQARPVAAARRASTKAISWRTSGIDPERLVVAIGASTGGTLAIEDLLSRVPADFPPTIIVQHMPVGFTASFAGRLNNRCALAVTEARDGEVLTVGRALVARGDTHLTVQGKVGNWRVQYTTRTPVNRHCPSVDVLFDSVAAQVGAAAIGVLLTGMGDDGARGLLRMRSAGALTVAQTKESSIVYGMPKVAVDLGAVQHQAAPEDIPALLLKAAAAGFERRAKARA
jgi:two-component system, chemotaxis family, protein-glutamate methylesterase/glutaminase